ncbi:4-hydroxythreonine-4-phosphate dehydrogenase PdxA [Salinigranum rubrum]|uniref:4-hydroxythreonine-4-phosphate dehydrogenase PdxA n=1 Tax=Salinigranum rubrum TaxID=755307 RepID=A0A2I8VEL5_9EURY|nr:4-hydroxythreonine-4-phosphate dehydrogenase PdxA [Salinigranum rubrum]AUV80367.1 4-hydroxythreonine-4-phosphate dehydrogenase PdxA [Salinigranum rubrum]
MTSGKPLVAVTMGDPAGIGAEVAVKAYRDAVAFARIVVVGDADVVRRAVETCGVSLDVRVVADGDLDGVDDDPDTLAVVDCDNVADLAYGDLRAEYGAASLEYVERAIDLAVAGDVDAIATAPINKQATRLAGSDHAGHTGLLAERTGVENYSMMLIEEDLRVTHVSTHVPLREACDLVTTDRVLDTISVTDEALVELGVDEPRIAVAGLNPHAGDGGLLGEEDDAEIAPAVERARAEGIDAVGPMSPDTVYGSAARGEFDCVVSMYHDQGHIPLKMLGFDASGGVSGVNMTIGLPIVRTSVDHGTAFDIAGEGVASETSMVDAVRVAASVARDRQAAADGVSTTD